MTIGVVRLETISRQTKTNTPWVPCKFRIKTIKSLQSLTFTFPFLMPPHLLHCFFGQEQPFQPWRDRYVMKLFDRHFCGNRDTIFVSHLHVSRQTTMHTFGVILVLLLEQHVIPFAHINLLVVHTETRHNLFRLVMLYRDEINNQLDDIKKMYFDFIAMRCVTTCSTVTLVPSCTFSSVTARSL
jgi:hypothetical protein